MHGLICWTCHATELVIEGDVCTCSNGHQQRVRARGREGWVAWRRSPRPHTGPFVDPTKGGGIYGDAPL